MTKKPLFLYLLLLTPSIFFSCTSAKIVKKSITYRYDNISFSPPTIVKEISSNVDISITPIDAKTLNKETHEAAFRDGNYKKDFVAVIDSWKSQLSSASRGEKILYQGKLNAFECLTKLEKDGKVPTFVALLLKNRIAYESAGSDGTDIETLGDGSAYSAEFNPYKVNRNYFSVFKVTFANKGGDLAKIKLNEFQLNSGEEMLYPLGSTYFEENLTGQAETIKNAYRLNMPTELVVTPQQRVTKYLAVPAINSDNGNVKVQLLKEQKAVDFDFKMTKKELSKVYNFELYQIIPHAGSSASYLKIYTVISFSDKTQYALRGNEVFVSDEKKNVQISIYSIGINKSNSSIVLGVENNVILSNSKKHQIDVDYTKMKKDKKTGAY